MKQLIKLKLAQLEPAVPVLKKLFDANFKDIKAAYALTRGIQTLDAELTSLFAIKQKLVIEYASKAENGSITEDPQQPGVALIPPDKKAEFLNRMIELLMQEIEIVVNTIPFSAIENLKLANGDSVTLTPRELLTIDFILDSGSIPDESLAPVPLSEMN